MNRLVPIFATLAAVGFAVTLYLVFYVTPLDELLFFNQKIFYYHVSSAFVLFATVFVCGIASAGYLKKRDPRWLANSRQLRIFVASGLHAGNRIRMAEPD